MRRNIMATMLLSQGTPMILMGDEVGRTQNGNNNAYCQDNEIAWLDWKNVGDRDRAFMEFVRGVIRMRKRYRILRANRFLHGEPVDEKGTRSVVWFRPDGKEMDPRSWSDTNARVDRHAPLRQLDAAPHPGQLLSSADPVHAAGVRRRRLDAAHRYRHAARSIRPTAASPPARRSSSPDARCCFSPGRWGDEQVGSRSAAFAPTSLRESRVRNRA